MSIKDQLTADMKQAMKDREAGKLRLNVIRMVRANIKNVEINDKRELTDDEVLAVLMKEVKMRQDSLEEFQKAGRDELVAQAKEEIAILKKYLPEALGDDELKAIVAEVIATSQIPEDLFADYSGEYRDISHLTGASPRISKVHHESELL